jgi:bifunctional non-homologous end joining protein LigD
MSLTEYRRKRDFSKTREPQSGKAHKKQPIFVVQEHWASHLHYDFRLEAFGTLKSWAVPKGPSTEVGDKRLAVEVEDHPIDYAKFHGTIPEGEYGAGKVKIWDKGVWIPPDHLRENLEKGHLEFELKGKKLHGRWLLQRTKRAAGKKSQWLLIKRHDPAPVKASAKKKVLRSRAKGKKDPWPEDLEPQLALLSDKIPAGDDWIHEVKFDGYRTFATIQKSKVTFLTRRGLDWSEKYKALEAPFKKLKLDSAIFDGEVVALDENGHSSFAELQFALSKNDFSRVVYYLFDLLYLNGQDLRSEPLETRKRLLKQVLQQNKSDQLRFSEHWRAQGEELFAQACAEGLEGIVSKNRHLAYHAGRDEDWQKIKCSHRQEFVIGGFTDPEGSRHGFGSLLMGVYDGKKLRYVGRVGTGFNSELLGTLEKKLKHLEIDSSPFSINPPPRSARFHWVRPELVAEIEFKVWTKDFILRHASFQGLREDKKATEVHLEIPQHPSSSTPKQKPKAALSEGKKSFTITHPERVIFPEERITKLDVANYYKTVAPWLLPHLQERPLALIRCPEGAMEECFFQKHVDSSKMTAIHEGLVRDQKVIYVDSEEGLLQLIQWGVLELHTWQCHSEKLENPDQIVFDLDPAEGVAWKEVTTAALRLKDLLDRLDLTSFLKTTGGKGLHLHVPIEPLYSWEQVKAFAKSVTLQMQSEFPSLYTTKLLKKDRTSKIFLDYLRNGFGATAVAPYSLRAKEHPIVAVPLTWKELKSLKGPQDFKLNLVLERLARLKKDPWESYFDTQQKISILEPTA